MEKVTGYALQGKKSKIRKGKKRNRGKGTLTTNKRKKWV
jgi:hypothetical protein